MGLRPVGLVRVGFRRAGRGGGGGLPFTAPLVPNAVVTIDPTGTTATTSAALLYEGTDQALALLTDGTTYTPVVDVAALTIKTNSGRSSILLDGGSFNNHIVMRGGGGSTDKISSSNLSGFDVGTNAAGFDNSGITMAPGNPGFASMTLTTDQVFVSCTKIGFFGVTPVTQRAKTSSGAAAGATYGANERAMLNDCFNTVRGLGFLT